jgi:hypothetical protein
LVGRHGILEQPVDDDHVHARQFRKIEDAMEQRLAAVNDDLKPEFFDVRASVASASGGLAQLGDFFAKRAKERDQFIAYSFLGVRPGL